MDLRQPNFSRSRRGYETSEVDGYIDQLSASVRELSVTVDQLRRDAEEAEGTIAALERKLSASASEI
ncbi:MAG: DivIVA domain-containing protein, partial [Acidimicrobiia bacterium]